MWMPDVAVEQPDIAEMEVDLVELLRGEPAGGIRAGRVEGDIPEIEQARRSRRPC